MLDIKTVSVDIFELDVLVCDIGNESRCVVIGLDSWTVLRVDDFNVGELVEKSVRGSMSECSGKARLTKIFVTLLLLFPPTDPILIPCPPRQYMSETVTLFPLVMATQSS